jgi:triosephosphate isomerase
MKKLIIANWKMTPNSAQEAKALFNATARTATKIRKVKIVVCPPFIYLNLFSKKTSVSLGAQDVFWESPPAGGGSYTGEISAKMLKNAGVEYVIVGHSERRRLGETDEMINKKIKQALESRIKVIFCVGELERDDSEEHFKFIKEEIIKGLDKIPVKLLKSLIITYEPVWAISSAAASGKARFNADTPEDAFQMATYIKRILVSIFGKSLSRVPILYGGSVDFENTSDFLKKENIDGLLVGRVSWNIKTFSKLLKNTGRL